MTRLRRGFSAPLLLSLVLVSSGTATIGAMRTTSTTFDEIVFMAVGARGFETGRFDLVPDHPPLLQYIYGLPLVLSAANLPDEAGVSPEFQQMPGYRYHYAARLLWGAGNDPERVAFVGRIPAVLMALGLVTAVFFFASRYWGAATGLLAAVLVAFLPDVLGHGGVAYSDVPVTLALFGAAWSLDSAVRNPSIGRGLVTGLLTGLALSIKISAAALLPLAIALIGAEFLARRQQPTGRGQIAPWLRRTAVAAAVATLAAYVVVVIVYRGDLLLDQFRYGLDYRYTHMAGGHGAAAFLLGDRSPGGWWYFFPVAFLFKTSAGLHALAAIGAVALAGRVRAAPARVLTSHLRLPLLFLLIFGAALISSNLNIGFRYAMPVLPWICIAAAVGALVAYRRAGVIGRVAIVALSFWAAAYPLSYYPDFLAFVSEYGPGRDENHRVLVDSSLDWGQGLLRLRDFMHERDIPSVYLSYFGSAWPEGYGIDYVPLQSFFPLPQPSRSEAEPEWLAISATNLQGVYFGDDPFAPLRDTQPDTVLGHTLFVYYLGREREGQ